MKRTTSDVTIVGCGGIGGYLALPLMKYLESGYEDEDSYATITLIDGDTFEKKNINRQICTEDAIGINKARYLNSYLNIFKQDNTNIEFIDEYITEKNVTQLLRHSQFIFVCVDNNKTRKIIDEWYSQLEEEKEWTTIINGGNEFYDGNIQVVNIETKSMLEVHKELREPTDRNPADGCINQLHTNPQLGPVNNLVASLMIIQFMKELEEDNNEVRRDCTELYFDIRSGEVVGYDRRKKEYK